MMSYAVESQITATMLPLAMAARRKDLGAAGRDKDTLLERLVRSLLPPEQAREVLRGYFTDAFHAKLLERLEIYRIEPIADDGPRKMLSLPEWRRKRVEAFLDHNLGQPITLACLARAAGLSRMHFAALFRRATGLRPHDYVIQRRIERAKTMLFRSRTPIVQVALGVGFQSQSHFTTVFRRTVGTTPQRWRQMHEPEDIAV
jgi:AraC-like DNA-binding protein